MPYRPIGTDRYTSMTASPTMTDGTPTDMKESTSSSLRPHILERTTIQPVRPPSRVTMAAEQKATINVFFRPSRKRGSANSSR
ncbi:hypothetical protein D9M68_816320 [compost metagenome]